MGIINYALYIATCCVLWCSPVLKPLKLWAKTVGAVWLLLSVLTATYMLIKSLGSGADDGAFSDICSMCIPCFVFLGSMFVAKKKPGWVQGGQLTSSVGDDGQDQYIRVGAKKNQCLVQDRQLTSSGGDDSQDQYIRTV